MPIKISLKHVIQSLSVCFFITLSLKNVSAALDNARYGTYQHVELIQVLDGDSIHIKVHLSPTLSQETIVHLRNIDAPEMKIGSKGKQAIKYCERRIGKRAANFVKQFLKQGAITLSNVGNGSTAYSVRGELWVRNQSLSAALLKRQLALPIKAGQPYSMWQCQQSSGILN